MDADKTFNCVVIAPGGLLLDCRTASVIFPAHDGQRGVLYNHIPMFCKLGLGIMEVKSAVPVSSTGSGPALNQVEGLDDQQQLASAKAEAGAGRDIFLLVDGGFVVVCLNLLKITSYDVVFPSKEKPKALEQIIAGISKKLADSQTDQEQRRHLTKKITLLTQLLGHT